MNTRLFFLLLFLSVSINGLSQNDKIGYINTAEVFAQWPEQKKASNQLAEYENQLQKTLQTKIQDFQTKVANYNNNAASMDAITKKDTETELQNLQSQIQKFETDAQEKIAIKNEELMNPLRKKLKSAIDAVGKEHNFTLLLDKTNSVLYSSDETRDLSYKVAQKLGFILTN